MLVLTLPGPGSRTCGGEVGGRARVRANEGQGEGEGEGRREQVRAGESRLGAGEEKRGQERARERGVSERNGRS